MGGGQTQINPYSTPSINSPFDFCNRKQKGVFTNGDQIGEVMCDWVAAEILPLYFKKYYPNLTSKEFRLGYLNSFRHFCYPQKQNNNDVFTVHPSLEKRINFILLANPKIREQMGCLNDLPGALYCDPKMITKDYTEVVTPTDLSSKTEKGSK